MSIPKYKYLLTYRYSLIVHDLTVLFCLKYLGHLSNLGNLGPLGRGTADRTSAQMVHAARSCKQNIVEGVSEKTSTKLQLNLLGVAAASYEELIADYEDFLRQHNLPTYPKTHPKISSFRTLAYSLSNLSNLSNLGSLKEKPKLFGNPTDDANFLLTLCHINSFMLSKQIKAAEGAFVTKGGYTENLRTQRLEERKKEAQKMW